MTQFTDEQLERRQLANELKEEGLKVLNEGKLQAAKDIFVRAKTIYEEIQDLHELSDTYNLISLVYDEIGDDSSDVDYTLDALQIALETNAYDLSCKFFNNLGSKYLDVNADAQALHYFNLATEMYEKGCKEGLIDEEKYHAFHLILNLNISSVYNRSNDLEKARFYYEKAKVASMHPSNEDILLTFLSYEGLLLWRLGEKDKAKNLVEEIIQGAQSIDYITDYMDIMQDLLALLKEMKDFDHWEKVLHIIDEHLTEDISIHTHLEVLRYWIDFYQTTENREAYLDTCVKFFQLSQTREAVDFSRRADSYDMKIQMRLVAKEKEHTDSIVYLDPLTGIGNRNRMLEDSKQYIKESYENSSVIMIGLIDVDYFKECNDTYGHIKGDACLQKVAQIIQETIGDRGNVYRYGGDEFLLLLPYVEEDEVLDIGKEIQDRMQEAKIENARSPISPYVTLSQGYTNAIADEGDTIETLINIADRVLYSVKRNGRAAYKYMYLDDIFEQNA